MSDSFNNLGKFIQNNEKVAGDGSSVENKKYSTLEDIDALIDSTLNSRQITLNTQDETIAPEIAADLKSLIRTVTDWEDFNLKLEEYRKFLEKSLQKRKVETVHITSTLRFVYDVMGQDIVRTFVRKYLKKE